MKPDNTKDSFFSTGKPKRLPWFYALILLGILGLIFMFKWFS